MEGFDLNDDGMVPVKVGQNELLIDLYRVHNDINDLVAANKGKSNTATYDAVREYLKRLGFPATMSHKAVSDFMLKEQALVEGLKKKDAPTPNSPASTGSTPSP